MFLQLASELREETAVIEPPKEALETYEITAYTVGDDFTPNHGITASGKRVRSGYVACPPHLSFGTEIYIPELDRTFVCMDRGGRIKGRKLDIYVTSRSKALEFGRRRMDVKIISQ